MINADIYKPQRSHSGGVFVFIILIALAVIGVATINIFLGKHAMEQHPDTTPLTRACVQKNGV